MGVGHCFSYVVCQKIVTNLERINIFHCTNCLQFIIKMEKFLKVDVVSKHKGKGQHSTTSFHVLLLVYLNKTMHLMEKCVGYKGTE